jgi:hypothetical protein
MTSAKMQIFDDDDYPLMRLGDLKGSKLSSSSFIKGLDDTNSSF